MKNTISKSLLIIGLIVFLMMGIAPQIVKTPFTFTGAALVLMLLGAIIELFNCEQKST